MKKIENQTLDEERALYSISDATVKRCFFTGPKDGESALKECKNIKVEESFFNLRYPFWHDDKLTINKCELTDKCRAALWYSKNINITATKLGGIKALRECSNIKLKNVIIDSTEFGWRCKNLSVLDSKVTKSEYFFFQCQNVSIKKLEMIGKYSFQYVKDVNISDSSFDTKDAFWHSKNVTVKNSTIKGEYLGWYSNGLTLINCKIIGTQPLCYCKNLKLVNCEMIDTDLAFEYSDVEATIKGSIDSVKNPKSGYIKADKIKEIILENSKYKCKCKIEEKHH